MFDQLTFKYPWRTYQARLLDKLALLQDDNKIHVVAPPGAGKTVLGLEIVRRMNRQTLVLVPSLTIRSQWTKRLLQDFETANEDAHSFISHDLRHPGLLTITTYQALHQYLKTAEADALEWVAVLVVDECHHLRREWWKSLDVLCRTVQPTLVALTATPPFDVSGLEWRRYHEFCGEIDEEISIPELVAAGDLCHHQDYVYPVLPASDILDQSRRFAAQKAALYERLASLRSLAQHLQRHPWLREPEQHYEAIFDAPEYFSALLVVLRYLGSEPPSAALGVLHGEVTVAPDISDEWLAIFLQKALRDDPYLQADDPAELLRPIQRQLTEMGAWEQGKIYLDEPPSLSKAVRNSQAKIAAVGDIVAHEWEQLGDALRLVVLTDFIYPELLSTTVYDRRELTKIGASTIFEHIRRAALPDDDRVMNLGNPVAPQRLAVLTGSLVILPYSAIGRLRVLSSSESNAIPFKPLFDGSDYVVLTRGEAQGKQVVGWVTQLFTEGMVNIIIGTTALLGEGWDAPAINSLVLASTVGSFVLSNQMRGRAIRTHTADPSKTANIWHPVTYNPALTGGGSDMQALQRRFKAFAGPTLDGTPIILNGLGRYDFDWRQADAQQISAFAQKMMHLSLNRQALAERWTNALAQGTHLIEAIAPPTERYYTKEDKLSRYYFELADRQQQEELDRFLLRWKMWFLMTFSGVALASLWMAFPLSSIYYSIPVLGVFGYLSYRRLTNIRATRSRMGLANHDLGMPDINFFSYPLLATLPLLFFSWVAPLLFLALLALLVYTSMSAFESRDSVARFELLANRRERLERYGRALLRSLLDANLLHRTHPEQLTIEETTDRQLVTYLAAADHHDTHLFAESLSELMRPIENPRWLLRLRQPPGWIQGEYYIPVPAELAKYKNSALHLVNALEQELNHSFDLIYTRDPAGRQHLLAAKLQMSNLSDDREAKREVLWR